MTILSFGRTHALSSRSSRVGTALGFFFAGAAAVGAIAWAVYSVNVPATGPLDLPNFTLAEVTPGEVGASIRLNTLAEWSPEPGGTNRVSGVVTGVDVEAGAEVAQGSILYTVNLRPVVVARGAVPAFRDVGEGTEGADVRQVQEMLADLGYYRGEVGGDAGPMTVAAIKAWQRKLGVEPTGVVGTGDVIFVPSLPVRVAVDPKLVFRGATLSGGEPVLSTLPASPRFTLAVTAAQAGAIPSGARVEISSPGGDRWTGLIGEQTSNEETGSLMFSLVGEGATVICGDQCVQVPVTGQTLMSSRVVTVESVAGLVVPSSALVAAADGQLEVIDESGRRSPVVAVAVARGMSVIEGVQAGTKVRVPGNAP